jgi:hypothetical protein
VNVLGAIVDPLPRKYAMNKAQSEGNGLGKVSVFVYITYC